MQSPSGGAVPRRLAQGADLHQPSDVAGDALRLMSFNIRNSGAADGIHAWPNRRTIALDVIQECAADLIGFQEVLADQHDDLAAALKGYSFAGVARDDGHRSGEWSLIAYRHERFHLIQSGNFWLSEQPDRLVKGWDAAVVRICSWVKLFDTFARRAFLYANTHWDHEGVLARKNSALLIKQKLSELAASLPVLMTGDFNACETDECIQLLLQPEPGQVRLIDSYRQVHPVRQPDEKTFHNFKPSIEGQRIDFVLHSPEWAAVSARIIRIRGEDGTYPSDHFPVTVVLNWRPNGEPA